MDTDEKKDESQNNTNELSQRKRIRRRDRKNNEKQSNILKLIERPSREIKYEYLDHTADILLHSWGKNIIQAFEMIGIAMYGYMTNLDQVQLYKSKKFQCFGHDYKSLLFNYLEECLGIFGTENYLLFKDIQIIEFIKPQKNENNNQNKNQNKIENENENENFDKKYKIVAIGYGEDMDLNKHEQGTEIKAPTYNSMQIKITKDKCDIYCVVDI